MRRIERKRSSAWQALLSPFAPCRRSGQRVAVQTLYIRFCLDFQGETGVPGLPRTYPELFAVLGGKVPDLRGLFLRGYGSQSHAQSNGSTVGITSTTHTSGALGQVQGDATRKIWGNTFHHFGTPAYDGAMYLVRTWNSNSGNRSEGSVQTGIDSSRVVPTADEIRPVNQAVRYLVRALP